MVACSPSQRSPCPRSLQTAAECTRQSIGKTLRDSRLGVSSLPTPLQSILLSQKLRFLTSGSTCREIFGRKIDSNNFRQTEIITRVEKLPSGRGKWEEVPCPKRFAILLVYTFCPGSVVLSHLSGESFCAIHSGCVCHLPRQHSSLISSCTRITTRITNAVIQIAHLSKHTTHMLASQAHISMPTLNANTDTHWCTRTRAMHDC